ncbi:MAG: M28 family peptidase [Planctomycetes bacterium]|nr:M28 family peptidase [Planctomycetota bacterium]
MRTKLPGVFCCILAACAAAPRDAGEFAGLNPENIRAHVAFLADDALEGRLPGARGGDLAAKYIATQAALLRLAPGGENHSYYQNVPLIGIDTTSTSTVSLDCPGKPGEKLKYLEDFVGADETLRESTRFEGQVVFVGYGIVAPEYQWNDYAGVDVRGKVVLILANEPGRDDPNSKLFAGPALTYYGRWTYKFEEATRRGAGGALLIHTDEAAGYGWPVVRNSWGRERPYPGPEGRHALSCAAWITERAAQDALARAGLDILKLRSQAEAPGFAAIPTNISASFEMNAKTRPIPTQNVVAVLPGSDPARAGEYIIFSAHYDHLGFATPENGDSICNGAVDNASGCAALLEVARVFAEGPRPSRSILFTWVTAEEGGLRGSEYFAFHPTVDPSKIIANLNMDGLPMSGDPLEVAPLGYDRSSMRQIIQNTAAELGLTIINDRNPAQGYFFRSDHFSFAKIGVPAISVGAGYKYKGHPESWGREREETYRKEHYHRPSDNYDPSWDCVAPARLAQFCYCIGLRLANSTFVPAYNPGDEFARAPRRPVSK